MKQINLTLSSLTYFPKIFATRYANKHHPYSCNKGGACLHLLFASDTARKPSAHLQLQPSSPPFLRLLFPAPTAGTDHRGSATARLRRHGGAVSSTTTVGPTPPSSSPLRPLAMERTPTTPTRKSQNPNHRHPWSAATLPSTAPPKTRRSWGRRCKLLSPLW